MIKTIIFDFGDVFINLDKNAIKSSLEKLKNIPASKTLERIHQRYEVGKITTDDFIEYHLAQFTELTRERFIEIWNSILLDFPTYRFNFIKELAASKSYKLILLSNTNQLHIDYIKKHVPFYNTFKNCFDSFYLSHEIHLRKPDTSIFNYVLERHQLQAHEVLFIDDTPINTTAAAALGINCWNNKPHEEDIVDLFEIKSSFFN